MGVMVQQQDVPKLMVGALAGLGLLFGLIVILNHVSGRAEVGVGR
jgi:hypothetical protein